MVGLLAIFSGSHSYLGLLPSTNSYKPHPGNPFVWFHSHVCTPWRGLSCDGVDGASRTSGLVRDRVESPIQSQVSQAREGLLKPVKRKPALYFLLQRHRTSSQYSLIVASRTIKAATEEHSHTESFLAHGSLLLCLGISIGLVGSRLDWPSESEITSDRSKVLEWMAFFGTSKQRSANGMCPSS